MTPFELVLRFPTGGVMVGGYSAVPDGVHGAHAVDDRGRPLIPATALRGALREALEAILRGAGEPACSGGDGLDPTSAHRDTAAVPCILDGGSRCKACRLFGSQRSTLDEEERAFSALVLGDAHAEGAVGWTIRPGVGLTRRSRTAEDGRLFMQQVPATPGQRFIVRGRLLDPTLKTYFEAALRATTHLGAGRSRGLARVDVSSTWDTSTESPLVLPETSDVRIRVRLLAPASIGAPVVHTNLRETRDEIPGAALRGAIGFALAEVLDDPDRDAAFQELVGVDGASFGFLHPVDDDGQTGGPSGPLPITAAACKQERHAHGVVDTLLDRLAAALITEPTQVTAMERDALSECNVCGQPLRALAGWRRRSSPIPTRTVTRVSLDRAHASAREGQLFTQVLLEAGTVFEGVIRNVPACGRAHLGRSLALPLSLGRARSAGWGRVAVEVLPTETLAPLAKRATAFDAALDARLRMAGLSTEHVGRLIPFTLMSSLITEGEDDGEALFLRGLEGASCILKARRFSREGGWEQRGPGMSPALASAAGGVFVIDLGAGRTWRDMAQWIAQIEQRGIGTRTHQGYGRTMAFDPVFLKRSVTR